MKRFFVYFGYDGTAYHGWQIQPNGNSVQAELQRCLSTLLREEITVTGAGRTDAGVITEVKEVASDLHARFSAIARTYHYYIHTQKDPFLRNSSCELHYALDFDKMNEAAAKLLTYSDFGAFCKSHADVKTTLCQVTTARWVQQSPYSWYFEITANRFLRNMVRAVVGTLIDVGRGRLSIDDFCRIIEGKKRTDAGESMPAHALFLEDVSYPQT